MSDREMKPDKEFKPFIPAEKNLPEFTPLSVILGILLAVLFGGANAYLGLRVGMTVSASIPAAVLSMGIIRVLLHRDSVLENNIVQTIGSAGESVAGGAIFTMPVLFLWASEWGTETPSLVEISIIAAVGGILGILFMVPLRKALIVQEHGVLPYPEGQACAEVLLAGETGGEKAGLVFKGLGFAALYKFVTDGLKLFPSEVHYEIPAYRGSGIGADVLPALVGVGYICGAKVSSYLFAGGATAWFVLMPLIVLFGGDTVCFPADISVTALYEKAGSMGIWTNFIKYIGAGALVAGGVISLIKALPLIGRTFRDALKDFGKKGAAGTNLRTDRDIPLPVIVVSVVVLAVVIWLVPAVPVNLLSAFLIVIFGFFFATVASRMVGVIGTSNSPVSGMTIAALLATSLIMKATGQTGREGMVAALAVGAVICVVTAISGDTSQDLKTGYIVGATPFWQQIGEIIGVVASSVAIGAILYLLNAAWGFDSTELPAPQAALMKMIVEGVMGGDLPWNMVLIGVFIGIVVEILGIPVLPFAVGLYLPIHMSMPIMVGGVVRLLVEKRKKSKSERKEMADRGILYCSGLIAGEGIVGILLALAVFIPKNGYANLSEFLGSLVSGTPINSNLGGIVFFALLLAMLWKSTLLRKKK
ncbi:MAG: oligopeptide transporter, OPT family [Eubacteriales bacterium]|nr:oligopeptide transporter, OPT family [Eubacteriales bacterium]